MKVGTVEGWAADKWNVVLDGIIVDRRISDMDDMASSILNL
jgi:hypothetical protein